jgi:hypothetical protein
MANTGTSPASDVYEWAPGGFFVHHVAYGRIGSLDVAGSEIIGYGVAWVPSMEVRLSRISPRSPPLAAPPR